MDWVLDTLKQTPLSENELRFLGGVLMEGGSYIDHHSGHD
jgi:hypothetical protein